MKKSISMEHVQKVLEQIERDKLIDAEIKGKFFEQAKENIFVRDQGRNYARYLGIPYEKLSTSHWLQVLGEDYVCPKCERIAPCHLKIGHGKCPTCGYYGKTITVREYIKKRLYR